MLGFASLHDVCIDTETCAFAIIRTTISVNNSLSYDLRIYNNNPKSNWLSMLNPFFKFNACFI